MRITKAWLRKAKTNILLRVSNVLSIKHLGGEPALRKEFEREFPHLPRDQQPAFESELIRQLIQWEIEKVFPSAVTD